ncbi:hypothetical protein [Frondihabitans sp. VKM Ac-2883]|uniref:hypothetical protein n=1 Tax=Frondihabitans sp. VKM Ac-2883 TaxID=2783823 RepID=UPI00188B0BC1|nr:hypothetical protein [Frondihabitans sp. VKM Ac-2883]MBF4577048.1 hypothetical protein [Frondihabitans sp. VKM Ac-2883]
MPSLIQRRMAIDRQRLSGLYSLVSGTAMTVVCCLELAFEGLSGFPLILGMLGIFSMIAGAVTRKQAHKALAEFEAAEGVGAGVQPPRKAAR